MSRRILPPSRLVQPNPTKSRALQTIEANSNITPKDHTKIGTSASVHSTKSSAPAATRLPIRAQVTLVQPTAIEPIPPTHLQTRSSTTDTKFIHSNVTTNTNDGSRTGLLPPKPYATITSHSYVDSPTSLSNPTPVEPIRPSQSLDDVDHMIPTVCLLTEDPSTAPSAAVYDIGGSGDNDGSSDGNGDGGDDGDDVDDEIDDHAGFGQFTIPDTHIEASNVFRSSASSSSSSLLRPVTSYQYQLQHKSIQTSASTPILVPATAPTSASIPVPIAFESNSSLSIESLVVHRQGEIESSRLRLNQLETEIDSAIQKLQLIHQLTQDDRFQRFDCVKRITEQIGLEL